MPAACPRLALTAWMAGSFMPSVRGTDDRYTTHLEITAINLLMNKLIPVLGKKNNNMYHGFAIQ
jgi:hypothetical protein